MKDLFEFSTKQELADSFTVYAMQSCGMDKISAEIYAKMEIAWKPAFGASRFSGAWVIEDFGYAPR